MIANDDDDDDDDDGVMVLVKVVIKGRIYNRNLNRVTRMIQPIILNNQNIVLRLTQQLS